jgi:hypothetical protein
LTEKNAADVRKDWKLMKNVDEAVEFDMINNLEQLCEEAKK